MYLGEEDNEESDENTPCFSPDEQGKVRKAGGKARAAEEME